MKMHRVVLSTIIGILTLAPMTHSLDKHTYNDPRPICDPADPRCKPPMPPLEP